MAVENNSYDNTPLESDQTPISKRQGEAAFATLKQLVLEDLKGNARWYSDARDDYDFESGQQWSEDERSRMKADERLYVTFNRIKPTVDVICGMEVQNRQEVKCFPRTQASPYPEVDPRTGQEMPPKPTDDDAEVNEGMSEAIRWARDNCDAEDEESDMYRDTVIAGMGWTETKMDYETDPEGRIVVERVDPMEMFWDCAAVKRNLDDARRQGRVRKDIAIEEARAMFPGVDDSDLHAGWAHEGQESSDTFAHDREAARQYANKGNEEKPRARVTIVEIQWFETVEKYQIYNPADGSTFIVDAEKYDQLEKLDGQPGPDGQPIEIISSPVKERCWYRAYLGRRMLELGKAPCEKGSNYRCVTGYRDRNRKQWYGIVRHMRDPQKWANKFFSVALEQIATSGKGLMAEQGAFVDDKAAERDWAKSGNIAWMKTGAIAGNKIMPKPPQPLLTGLSDLMQFSLQSIRDVTGVNQEALGATNRDQAASLEYQRTKQASVILASLFDNLRRYRKEQGRLLVYFIREYISDGRLIRVLGPQGNPRVLSLIKQPDTLQYDIIVDEAPSSPNQKEAAWLVTQQLMPVILKDPNTPPQVLIELLRGSPLPESNVQRIQKAYDAAQKQRAQAGPSLQEQQLQADIQKTQADAQKSQAEGAIKLQELEIRKYEADMNAQLTIEQMKGDAQQRDHDMAMNQAQLQQTAQQQQFEAAKAQLELQAAQQQQAFDLKMRELEAQSAALQQTHDSRMADAQAKNETQKQDHDREMGSLKIAGEYLKQARGGDGEKKQPASDVAKGIEELAKTIAKMAEAIARPKTAKLAADGQSAVIQ